MVPQRSPDGRPVTVQAARAPSSDGANPACAAGGVRPADDRFAINDVGLRLDHLLNRDDQPVPRGEVARALGWQPTRLAEVVSGTTVPSLPRAFALAGLLGCAVEDLYPDTVDAAREQGDRVREQRGWTVAPSRSPRRLLQPGASPEERWRSAADLATSAPAAFAVLGLLVFLGIRWRGPPPVHVLPLLRRLGENNLDVAAVVDRLVHDGALLDLGVQWRWREPLRLDLRRVATLLGSTLGAVRAAIDRFAHDKLVRADGSSETGECAVDVAWEHLAPSCGV